MPARSRLYWPLVVLGAAAASVGAVLLALGTFPALQYAARPLAMAGALVPYGVPAWALAATAFVGAALTRRRRGPTIAAVLAALALAVQAAGLQPYLPRSAPPVTGAPLRVFTANLLFGWADGQVVAEEVRRAHPDVVVFVEYSEAIDISPAMADLKRDYPYRIGSMPRDYEHARRWDPSGTQVWSRTPLTQLAQADSPFDQFAVRVERPGTPVTLIAAHPMNMVGGTTAWRQDAERLTEFARPHLGEPLVIAGDFNATLEQPTLQLLLALGLSDAGVQAGAGWLPTYPADRWYGPLAGIDHVLVNDRVVAQAVRTVALPRTDHRALVADLVVTR